MTTNIRQPDTARDASPPRRGSAVTVLFLLLFAGALVEQSRARALRPSRAITVAATESRICTPSSKRWVLSRRLDGAPQNLRNERPAPRFRRIETGGLPMPRAPGAIGRSEGSG